MSNTRRGRLLANLALTVGTQLVNVASQILLVPAFLSAWGERAYGDWVTISAISAYLTLSDIGMQLYVINRLTAHEVRNEREDLTKTVQSALLVYAAMSAIALAGTIAFTFLPWRAWWAGRPLAQSAGTVGGVLGAGIVVTVWFGFFSALFRVIGEPHRATGLALAQRSLALGATFAVLWLGGGPLQLALAQLICGGAFLVLTVADVQRKFPVPILRLSHADWPTAVGIVLPSLTFALLTLANGLTIQGTLLVASSMLGPVAVTAFSTARTMANVVKQGSSILAHVAWPEFTRLDAEGDTERSATAHMTLIKVVTVISAIACAILWFEGAHLYQIWTRGKVAPESTLFRLLLAHILLQAPTGISVIFLTATNRHSAIAKLSLLTGVVTVGAAPLAVRALGVAGLGWTLLGAEALVISTVVPALVQRALNDRALRYYVDVYVGTALIAGLLLFVGRLAEGAVSSAVTNALLVAAVVSITGVVALWIWLTPQQRSLVLSLAWRGRKR